MKKLFSFIALMIMSGSGVSSKRAAGLYLVFLFGMVVLVMAVNGDYTAVKYMGYLAALLLGVTAIENILKK